MTMTKEKTPLFDYGQISLSYLLEPENQRSSGIWVGLHL